jgi:predicted ATP-grasp superfamily ATP-dependent carboligase
MDLSPFFKSIVEQDTAAVVICDLNHTIIYMNPTAIERYSKRGGVALIGQSLLNCHNANSGTIINKVIDWFKSNKEHNIIHTYYNEKENKDVYMVALRNDKSELIGYYEKHEYRTKDDSPMYKF